MCDTNRGLFERRAEALLGLEMGAPRLCRLQLALNSGNQTL